MRGGSCVRGGDWACVRGGGACLKEADSSGKVYWRQHGVASLVVFHHLKRLELKSGDKRVG